MAYKTEELKAQAIKAITENGLYFITDIIAYLPCTSSTFYEHFPSESEDYKDMDELLTDNKVEMKVKIRAKLSKGEKAAELLALYRLICTPEERQSLNQSYIDHTSKGKQMNNTPLSDEEKKDAREGLNEEY